MVHTRNGSQARRIRQERALERRLSEAKRWDEGDLTMARVHGDKPDPKAKAAQARKEADTLGERLNPGDWISEEESDQETL